MDSFIYSVGSIVALLLIAWVIWWAKEERTKVETLSVAELDRRRREDEYYDAVEKESKDRRERFWAAREAERAAQKNRLIRDDDE